jgi:16S rRNA (guanine(966)-N(2))-methyltransferase RsmD
MVPPGVIRPAMDRMRESAFAALGDLSGLSFLDLFAGSGIIALEAASRGAAVVEAVEKDKGKSAALLENVSISPVRILCHFMPAELFVSRAKKSFDLVFCDPPFPYKWKQSLVAGLFDSAVLKHGSRLIIHHPAGEKIERLETGQRRLEMTDTRAYGRSILDFFELKE